jgi:hypothetical protein
VESEGLVVTLSLWNEELEVRRIQKRIGLDIRQPHRRDVLERSPPRRSRRGTPSAGTRAVWLGSGRIFEAAVRVCAPLVAPGSGPTVSVDVLEGDEARRAGAVRLPADPAASWGAVAAVASGVPTARPRTEGRVGDLASATAGFRDLFYALKGAVLDLPDAPGPEIATTSLPVFTAGLIDPLHSRWGAATTRLGGRGFRRPALPAAALDDLPEPVSAWIRARLVPKILVATQTRVVEALPDPDGRMVPCTPVVAVTPHDPADLWLLAAVLASPPVTLAAVQATAGSALHHDAVKPSARQVLELPLPADRGLWAEGAALARRAADPAAASARRREDLLALGRVMCAAYGLTGEGPVGAGGSPAGDEVFEWWHRRLPPERA